MDEGIAELVLQFQRLLVCIIIDAVDQTNLRAVASRCFNFGNRRTVRQADYCPDAVFLGGKGNPLGMVSGRAGDNAFCLLLCRELRHLVACPADLEGTCHLQVLGFQIQFEPRRKLRSVEYVSFPHHIAEDVTCLIDTVQCEFFFRHSFPLSRGTG